MENNNAYFIALWDDIILAEEQKEKRMKKNGPKVYYIKHSNMLVIGVLGKEKRTEHKKYSNK